MPAAVVTTTLSSRITLSRTSIGLSRTELAETLGVSRKLVEAWEHSRRVPPTTKLVALCDALDVSVDWLLRG